MALNVLISPHPSQIRDDNGVGRVVHAQYRYLPEHGIRLVGEPAQADVVAAHITGDGLPRVDVLMTHGLYWSDIPAKFEKWMHEANQKIVAAARQALAVTVPSPWVAEPFKRDMRIVPDIVGHGIEFDQWRPGDNRGYVLWNKNRAADVCDPTPAWELARRGVLVTTTRGPVEEPIPETLVVLGVMPHARMKALVQHADVYLATVKETFGIGTLEALASGVPVLGYRWGGTADIVRHGVDGWLVTPGDIDGLMEGLDVIRQRRAEMSAAARERARQYDWHRVMAQYATIYHRVAAERANEARGVAVVITNYNYGALVGGAVESVLRQTVEVDEVVVIDDGSTDDSLERLAPYRDSPRVRIIQQANQGVAAARNNGITATKAPFVICLDADDQLAPHYVEACRKAMMADRGLGIAYTGLGLLGPDGRITPNAWPPDFDWTIQATPRNPPSNCIPSAAMFRRAMWERAGGYKQVYAPGEDTEFFTRGLSVGFTARRVTQEPLFWYRAHEGSASRTKTYRPIDAWHPWMRDKQYPMGAPATTPPVVRSYGDPTVSVIIPVGPGHARYLPAALDSVLGQTCRAWEMIVVNDSGEPLPTHIMRPYPFAQVIAARGGEGPGAARNRGILVAKAPLLLLLDSDDYIMPDAIEKMLKAFVTSGGRYIYTDWLSLRDGNQMQGHEVPEYSQEAWIDRGQHAITALIPAAWVKAVGGFDEQMAGWEDWDFFIKLAVGGYCGARLAEPLLGYRMHTGQQRELSLTRKDGLLAELRARYARYARGEEQMSGCCGGNGGAILAAKQALGDMGGGGARSLAQVSGEPIGQGAATVRMRYVGENVGAISFVGTNRSRRYRGGNNPSDRYADVHKDDVEHLVLSGRWVVDVPTVPTPAAPEPTVVAPTVPIARNGHSAQPDVLAARAAIAELIEAPEQRQEEGEEEGEEGIPAEGQPPVVVNDLTELGVLPEFVQAVAPDAEKPRRRGRRPGYVEE